MSPYATMSRNVDIAAAQGSIQKRSCLKWVNCKNSCYCAQWAKLLEEESEVEAKAWGQCRPSVARHRLATLRVFKSINRFQAPNVRNAEQKLQTCLDRVDSQGWLGVGLGLFWVLAGLIELRLRHLGRFDFRKANMRFWIVCERDCPCVLQKDKSCELSWEWNQVKSPCTLAKRALSIALYNVGLDACGRAHSWLVGFVSSLLCW